MIDFFLTQRGDIHRLANSASREYTVSVAGNVKCTVRPSSQELVVVGEGTFWNTFDIYFLPDVDIHDSDQVTVDGKKYIVKGTIDKKYGHGRVNHIKVSAVSV